MEPFSVNQINAPVIARARGITPIERKLPDAGSLPRS
jgi:hypothetical protein